MPLGGRRPGAGRPPGSKNKATVLIAQQIAKEGITPLELTLRTMRKAWARTNDGEIVGDDLTLALSCARDAMSFIHPRLQATTVDGDLSAQVSGDLTVYWGGVKPKPADG